MILNERPGLIRTLDFGFTFTCAFAHAYRPCITFRATLDFSD